MMWKTIVACGSLFLLVAFGVRLCAHLLEPSFVPALAALATCLVGVALILLAPTVATPDRKLETVETPPVERPGNPTDLTVALR